MWVVAGALSGNDGRWLMHRRPLHKHHGGLWEFPGGKVEPGEMPTNALVRELAEELGVRVNPAKLIPASFAETPPADGNRGIVILLYTLSEWTGEPMALDAGAAIDWFTPREIAGLALPPLDRQLCRMVFPETAD